MSPSRLSWSYLVLLLASFPSSGHVAAEDKLSALGCMLAPSEKVAVSSAVPGVLGSVNVKRGARVIEGDILFQLKAGVEQASVELARVKAGFSERKAERNKALYVDDILTEHERDEIETELVMAQSELNLREQELDLRTVTSPITGVVVNRFNNVGEYVNVDPVLELATLDPLHVDLLLPAEYFGQIQVNQKIRIQPETLDFKARTARVSIVDPLIDPASGTFRVRLVMRNPNNLLPAGIRCSASRVK